MKKRVLFSAVVAAVTTLSLFAEEAPAPSGRLTGQVGFASDYRYRGVSETLCTPSFQANFDYNHDSGFYLGTFASNSTIVRPDHIDSNNSMVWAWYGGYKYAINDMVTGKVGAYARVFPGARHYNTAELNIGFGIKPGLWSIDMLDVMYSHSMTNVYGLSGTTITPYNWQTETYDANNGTSKGSGYLEAAAGFELPDNFYLKFHVGKKSIRHYKSYNMMDWEVKLSRVFEGFNCAIAYVGTDAQTKYFNMKKDGIFDTSQTAGHAVVVSLSRSF